MSVLILAGTRAMAAALFALAALCVPPAAPHEVTAVGPSTLDYEWTRVPLGAGGFVTGLALAAGADGRTVAYARTDVGGALRWDHASSTWSQLLRDDAVVGGELGPSDYSVLSVAVDLHDPDRVFLATGADFDPRGGAELSRTGKVWRSDDGGRHWRHSDQRWFVNGNQPARLGSERLAVDPLDPDHVLFGTQREGLWQSFDGGATWSQVPLDAVPAGSTADPEEPQAGVSFVEFAQRTTGPPVLLVGVANRGVYVTGLDGEWEELLPLGVGRVPLVAAVSGDRAVVPVNSPGSDDAYLVEIDLATLGTREIPTPARSDTWHVAVDPSNPRHLVLSDAAVRDGRLWTTVDGGAAWTDHDVRVVAEDVPWLATTDLDQWMSVGRLMFDPVESGRVWFAEGMGVWTADDVTADVVTWTSASRGLEVTVVSGVLPLAGGSALVSVADRQGFAVQPGGEYPATTLLDGRFVSGTSMDQSGLQPSTIAWVGGEAHRGRSPDRTPRAAVSHDGGRTWVEMGGLVRDMFAGEVAVSATDPGVMVWMPSSYDGPRALQDNPVGVFVTADGGRSWQRSTIDGEDGTFHRVYAWYTRRALAADRVDGSFYAVSDHGRFYVSVDGGVTWSPAPHAPPCSMDVDCHVYGQIHATPGVAGEVWATVGAAGLYVTENAGATPWRRVEGIEEAHAFAIATPADGSQSVMYLHGRRRDDETLTLLTSTDGGETWAALEPSRPLGLAQQINAIGIDPSCPERIFVGLAGSGVVRGEPIGANCPDRARG